MKTGPTRHPFVDDDPPDVDPQRGVHYCGTCFLPSTNAIHEMPERDEEERQHEQRRIGER